MFIQDMTVFPLDPNRLLRAQGHPKQAHHSISTEEALASCCVSGPKSGEGSDAPHFPSPVLHGGRKQRASIYVGRGCGSKASTLGGPLDLNLNLTFTTRHAD